MHITTQQARALHPETSRSISLMPLPIAIATTACCLIDVRPLVISAEISAHLSSILDHDDICLWAFPRVAPLETPATRARSLSGANLSISDQLPHSQTATYSTGHLPLRRPFHSAMMVWRHGVSQIWHSVKCLLSDEWRLLHSPSGGIRRRIRVHKS